MNWKLYYYYCIADMTGPCKAILEEMSEMCGVELF
jgi:hypothetical protein